MCHVPGVDAWCPYHNGTSLTGSNGQACFWFSNGCSIGCPECDGSTRGPIPNQPEFAHKMDVCGLKYPATICDPNLRTVNTGAKCGAEDDYYYYRHVVHVQLTLGYLSSKPLHIFQIS